MRISDHRYSRDLRKHNLALRMIEHEARTQTIRAWTGLSEERVVNLYQSYASAQAERHTKRHRGPSPQKVAFFMRSSQMRSEAAALAGLCRLLSALPAKRMANARRDLPGISRGEKLCRAFEMYREFVPDSEITFDHLVLLVTALAQGTELEMAQCANCGCIIVVDRFENARRVCCHCTRHPDEQLANALTTLLPQAVRAPSERQRNLF